MKRSFAGFCGLVVPVLLPLVRGLVAASVACWLTCSTPLRAQPVIPSDAAASLAATGRTAGVWAIAVSTFVCAYASASNVARQLADPLTVELARLGAGAPPPFHIVDREHWRARLAELKLREDGLVNEGAIRVGRALGADALIVRTLFGDDATLTVKLIKISAPHRAHEHRIARQPVHVGAMTG